LPFVGHRLLVTLCLPKRMCAAAIGEARGLTTERTARCGWYRVCEPAAVRVFGAFMVACLHRWVSSIWAGLWLPGAAGS
jgi:hypothetical protein